VLKKVPKIFSRRQRTSPKERYAGSTTLRLLEMDGLAQIVRREVRTLLGQLEKKHPAHRRDWLVFRFSSKADKN
jgi:hypothetical protein